MSTELPRVTYSNIGVDFSPVHAHVDSIIGTFEKQELGKDWTTPFATGQTVDIVSPIADDLLLGRFPQSTQKDIDAAVASARQGAQVWNATSTAERLAFAKRWRAALNEQKYQLALAALYEIGKSRIEALGEADECLDMVDFYASELDANGGYTKSMNALVPNESALSVMKPYGTFGVIAPFNFPLALSVGMTSGALLTGNAVVFKPSPGCALTALILASTLEKAGLPKGVFNLVLGDGEVGRQLAQHPGIDGVAFTGSHKTGMSIFRHMAGLPYMKPVVAEMGGKNPAYVTRHADLDEAAQGVARSVYGLQGQKCSACSVVYVDNAVKAAFIEKLQAFAQKLVVGDPRQQATFMGPVYNQAAADRFHNAVAQAQKSGQVLFGGTALKDAPNGKYLLPTAAEVTAAGPLTRDELFIPFVAIRGVDSLAEGLKEGNDIQYGLSAGIYTKDAQELQYFVDHAQAGVLYANRASGATTGAWPGSQPFCGWKGTGVSGKGGLGKYFLPQFMREQSHTFMG
jgi:1-pyrroline-5-carboxylate dehydrogenase